MTYEKPSHNWTKNMDFDRTLYFCCCRLGATIFLIEFNNSRSNVHFFVENLQSIVLFKEFIPFFCILVQSQWETINICDILSRLSTSRVLVGRKTRKTMKTDKLLCLMTGSRINQKHQMVWLNWRIYVKNAFNSIRFSWNDLASFRAVSRKSIERKKFDWMNDLNVWLSVPILGNFPWSSSVPGAWSSAGASWRKIIGISNLSAR